MADQSPDKLDQILNQLGTMFERLDAAETERKTHGEKLDALTGRMDSFEKSRADSESAQREAVSRADSDLPRFVEAQERADRVAHAFGDSAGAPRWLHGETLADYRRRLLSKYKRHSRAWAEVDLGKITDDAALGVAEATVYADAVAAANSPLELPPNTLRQVTTKDASGRQIHRFIGADDAAWNTFTYFPDLIRAGKIVARN